MNPNPNKKLMPASRATLIMEGIALGGFALALSSQYWIKDEPGISPPPSAVIAGLIFLPAMGVGIVAAIMLIINILRKKIDLGTVIAVVPFLGFAIWGVWYSYTDPHKVYQTKSR